MWHINQSNSFTRGIIISSNSGSVEYCTQDLICYSLPVAPGVLGIICHFNQTWRGSHSCYAKCKIVLKIWECILCCVQWRGALFRPRHSAQHKSLANEWSLGGEGTRDGASSILNLRTQRKRMFLHHSYLHFITFIWHWERKLCSIF